MASPASNFNKLPPELVSALKACSQPNTSNAEVVSKVFSLEQDNLLWKGVARELNIQTEVFADPKQSVLKHFGDINDIVLNNLDAFERLKPECGGYVRRSEKVFEQRTLIEIYISHLTPQRFKDLLESIILCGDPGALKLILQAPQAKTLPQDCLAKAAQAGYSNIAKILIDAGCVKDPQSIALAVTAGNVALLGTLLDAKVPFPNNHQLMEDAITYSGTTEIVAMLLGAGIPPTQDLIDLAEQRGRPEIRNLLSNVLRNPPP